MFHGVAGRGARRRYGRGRPQGLPPDPGLPGVRGCAPRGRDPARTDGETAPLRLPAGPSGRPPAAPPRGGAAPRRGGGGAPGGRPPPPPRAPRPARPPARPFRPPPPGGR